MRNESKDLTISWAKNVLHRYARAVCRIARLYDFVLDDDDIVRHVRRAARAKKKRKSVPPLKRYKYGIQVPRTVKEAIIFDEKNGNNL